MESNKDLEQKIKDELEIGFKKLNFALKSYNNEFTANLNIVDENIIFQLNGPTGSMLTYGFSTLYEAFDKLTEFKKEAINICSHQKKERH